ncbi:MAG: TetR/AcrR family transcriptional regulator [Chloroflexi bacterium]|nr:TetR/AcrR family transcriptional regulator [Chloroflexota bacterium]
MKANERRELILSKAKQVFARHSYRDASTSELAHESEVSEPMLYKHFGSKKGLFLQVLEQFGNRFTSNWQNHLSQSAKVEPLKALAEIGLEYRSAIKADPDILKVFFQAIAESSDPEIAQVTRRNNQNARAFIRQLLEQAQTEGLLDPKLNLEAATWGYMGIAYAMQVSLMLSLDEELDEAMLNEVNQLWLRALHSSVQ